MIRSKNVRMQRWPDHTLKQLTDKRNNFLHLHRPNQRRFQNPVKHLQVH